MKEFMKSIILLLLIPVRAILTPFAFIWDLVGLALEATGNYKRDFEIDDISLRRKS